MDETRLVELMRSVIREELARELEPLRKDMAEFKEVQREMLHMLKESTTEARSQAKHLGSIQERQQSVIEMLSIRSVQQEAEIRTVKEDVQLLKGEQTQ